MAPPPLTTPFSGSCPSRVSFDLQVWSSLACLPTAHESFKGSDSGVDNHSQQPSILLKMTVTVLPFSVVVLMVFLGVGVGSLHTIGRSGGRDGSL